MNENYTVYTDGRCAWNPGGPGGAASVIIDRNGEVTETSHGYHSTTCNRMEVIAAINALYLIPKKTTIDLYSNSRYLLNGIEGNAKQKKNTDLWNELRKASDGIKIIPHWIKAHSGDHFNEECNQLCSLVMITPTEDDIGYLKSDDSQHALHEKPKRQNHINSKLGAMGIDIQMEDGFKDREPSFMTNEEYAKKWHVNPSCAMKIFQFYSQSKHKFKSYVMLKSDGSDYWSSKKAEDILQNDPQKDLIMQTVQDNISNPYDQDKVIRWYARGLTLEDAIRKVLVDSEVSFKNYIAKTGMGKEQ